MANMAMIFAMIRDYERLIDIPMPIHMTILYSLYTLFSSVFQLLTEQFH